VKTKNLKPGQPIEFEVALDVWDVQATGQIFIPERTAVHGSIVQVDQTGKGPAKLMIALEPVQTIFGSSVHLSEKEPVATDKLTMKDLGPGAPELDVVPFVPVYMLMVLFQRKDVFLHKGMRQWVYVAETLEIDPAKVAEGRKRLQEILEDACRKKFPVPKTDQDYESLASCLTDAGDLDGAIVEYQRAIDMKPQSPWLHDSLARDYGKKGDFSRAIAEMQRAVQLKPKEEILREHLINLLEESGDLESADTEFKEAIGIWPSNYFLHYFYGRLLVKRNDLEGGIAELQWALKMEKGKFPAASCSLGEAFERKGDLAAALHEYYTAYVGHVQDLECKASYERLQKAVGK
jgi:Tfp pilus assembly protein PilF